MSSQRNVLVLHGEPLYGMVSNRVLSCALPVEVRWVPDVPAALTMLEQWTPDVLIADFVDQSMEPLVDAEDLGTLVTLPLSAWRLALSYVPLVMAWRARIAPRRAPIIAMGDWVWPLPPSLRRGMDVVAELNKPFTQEELIQAVAESCDLPWTPKATHPRDGST
jgi:CheY-like chemotaxis protein